MAAETGDAATFCSAPIVDNVRCRRITATSKSHYRCSVSKIKHMWREKVTWTTIWNQGVK